MSTFSTCTSSTKPSSPDDGDVLFETDTKRVIIYDGTSWVYYNNDGVFNPNDSTKYVEFDAVSDYATVDDHSSLNFGTGSFSISLWLNDGGSGEVYFKKGAYASNNGWGLTTIGNKYLFITKSSTTSQDTLTSSSLLQSGFTHIVCVYNSTAGTKEIFINGSDSLNTNSSFLKIWLFIKSSFN
mgnify:FL=1